MVLRDDLVNATRPREEVEVTSVDYLAYDYFLTTRSGFPVFSMHVATNYLWKQEDTISAANLTMANRKLVLDLKVGPGTAWRIMLSIARHGTLQGGDQERERQAFWRY